MKRTTLAKKRDEAAANQIPAKTKKETVPKVETKKIVDFEETTQINDRFFQVISLLIEKEKIRSMIWLADQLQTNRANFYMAKSRAVVIPPVYLNYLVKNYSVSAHWLLTGEGEMFYGKI